MDTKKLLLFVGLPVFVVALFAWSAHLEKEAPLTMYKDTNIACLPNGHVDIAVHIHPELRIFVDGVQEVVPANIGIEGSCMSETHTHDTTGTLHIETATRERFETVAFSDFMAVWGVPVEREGYALAITVDGEAVASIDEVPLKDQSVIAFNYASIDAGE